MSMKETDGDIIRWHECYYDFIIAQWVGRLGAMRYLIDNLEGDRITKGYHSFYMDNGTLMGQRGAMKEHVVHL